MSEPTLDQLTPEQIVQRKKELTKFYIEQIDFLKTQVKYEELLTQIEDSRARREMARMKWIQIRTQMMGPQDEPENKEEPSKPTGEKKEEVPVMEQREEGTPKETVFRTLKKEKI